MPVPLAKARSEVERRQTAHQPPARRDRSQWAQYECAVLKAGMGNAQPARAKARTIPGGKIQVEHARSPAPTPATAELALHCLECDQHPGRVQLAFDQGHRIGKVSSRAPNRLVQYDRRGVEQLELGIQPRDRRFDYAGWAPVTDVAPIGADRDGV